MTMVLRLAGSSRAIHLLDVATLDHLRTYSSSSPSCSLSAVWVAPLSALIRRRGSASPTASGPIAVDGRDDSALGADDDRQR